MVSHADLYRYRILSGEAVPGRAKTASQSVTGRLYWRQMEACRTREGPFPLKLLASAMPEGLVRSSVQRPGQVDGGVG